MTTTARPQQRYDHWLRDLAHRTGDVTIAPVVVADAGVENVNAQVDELIETGVLRRLLAFTEL